MRARRPAWRRSASPADIEGYWAYEQVFDDMRKRLRTGSRDSWIGDSPTRDELEAMLGHDQWMIDILFEASIADVLDHYVERPAHQGRPLRPGVIGAYAGPRDWGTASVKLMHYQGDLEGQGPVWGYVRGGMGMISFALAEAAAEAGAVLASVASRSPRSCPARASAWTAASSSALERSCATPTPSALGHARRFGRRAGRHTANGWRRGRCAARS